MADSDQKNNEQSAQDELSGGLTMEELETMLADSGSGFELDEDADLDAQLADMMARESKQAAQYTDAAKAGADGETNEGDIPTESLTQLQDMFSKLSEDKLVNVRLDEFGNIVRDTDDIDIDIQEALSEDDSAALLAEGDMDFIEEVEIYDTTASADEKVSTEGIKVKKPKVPIKDRLTAFRAALLNIKLTPIHLVIIGVCLGIVSFSVMFGITLLTADAPEPGVVTLPIAQPAYLANDADFIYLEQELPLAGQSFSLSKLLLSPGSTDIYFRNAFDVYQYNMSLTDNNGKTYMLDLSSLPERKPRNISGVTVVRMQPLDVGVTSFTLNMADPETQDRVSLSFKLDKPLVQSPVRMLEAPIQLKDLAFDNTITISDALFTSSLSRIDFAIEPGNSGGQVLSAVPADGYVAQLSQNGRPVLPEQAKSKEGERSPGGRLTFGPLKSLAGTAVLTFWHLMEMIDVDQSISLSSILSLEEGETKTIYLRRYKVLLEGAMRSAKGVVLVLHGEDTQANNPDAQLMMEAEADAEAGPYAGMTLAQKAVAISESKRSAPSPSPSPLPIEPDDDGVPYNRVETNPDIELAIRTHSGGVIKVPGVVRTGRAGTDVVFDCAEHADAIRGLSNDSFSFHVKRIGFKVPDTAVTFNLDKMKTSKSARAEADKAALEHYFTTRLAVKSGGLAQSDVEGFLPGILKKPGLAALYEASEAAGEETLYSAQVQSVRYDSEDSLTAVIKEIWQSSPTAPPCEFIMTHEVRAEMGANGLVVTQDKIIVNGSS